MITNNQRKCFGLPIIEGGWKKIEVLASRYDTFKTYAFVSNGKIVKCVQIGDEHYCEYALDECLSEDTTILLKKTAKGKDEKLTSATLLKRTPLNAVLSFSRGYISLYSNANKRDYYNNAYESEKRKTIDCFYEWASKWEIDTTDRDISDVENFMKTDKKFVKYNEGDIFVFKLNRRLYGYGRILVDYNNMRKKKEPFWDILMGTPLVASAYYAISDSPNMSVDDLMNVKSLPSSIIADNVFYYDEYKIIGNIPLTDNEDYPIMYGRSISTFDKGDVTLFQRGKQYMRLENTKPLYNGFINNGVSFRLNISIPILEKCIKDNSNKPYWESGHYCTKDDLRNPIYKCELKKIRKQLKIKL